MIGRYCIDCFGRRVLIVAVHRNAKKNVSRITYVRPDGVTESAGIEDDNSIEGWTFEPEDEWFSVRFKAIADGWTWREKAPVADATGA